MTNLELGVWDQRYTYYILFRERMPKIQETLASGDQEAIAKLIGTMPFTVWHQTAVWCTKCEWHRNTKVVFKNVFMLVLFN